MSVVEPDVDLHNFVLGSIYSVVVKTFVAILASVEMFVWPLCAHFSSVAKSFSPHNLYKRISFLGYYIFVLDICLNTFLSITARTLVRVEPPTFLALSVMGCFCFMTLAVL